MQIPGVIRSGGEDRQINVPWSIRDVLLAAGVVIGVVIVTIVVASLLLRLAGEDGDWLADGELLGFPAPLALALLLEAFFLGAVYFYAGVKRAATIRQLGFLAPAGRKPYLLTLGAWLAGLAALIVWNLLTQIIGIDLLMWGSDFPPSAGREGYHNALEGIRSHPALSGGEDAEEVMGRTAARVFGFVSE